MSQQRFGLCCAIILGALAGAGPALAQPVDAATKATARAIAEEGLAHFDGGRWLAALDRFNRAEALVHAPTMSLMAARCLEKLGRLIEANERYLAAARAQLDAGASEAFKGAVAEAEKEQKALLPRIPKLSVGLRGARSAEVEVLLDGKQLPAALIGVERLTDPGKHQLRAKRGDEVVAQSVELREGQTLEVALDFQGGGAAPERSPWSDPGPTPGSTQRALGWVGVGLGAGGLVMGGVTLGLALSAKSNLVSKTGCTADLLCPNTEAAKADVAHYRTLRPLPATGLIAGGVLAATGVVLLVTAPKGPPAGKAAAVVVPWIGPDRIGIAGEF